MFGSNEGGCTTIAGGTCTNLPPLNSSMPCHHSGYCPTCGRPTGCISSVPYQYPYYLPYQYPYYFTSDPIYPQYQVWY